MDNQTRFDPPTEVILGRKDPIDNVPFHRSGDNGYGMLVGGFLFQFVECYLFSEDGERRDGVILNVSDFGMNRNPSDSKQAFHKQCSTLHEAKVEAVKYIKSNMVSKYTRKINQT